MTGEDRKEPHFISGKLLDALGGKKRPYGAKGEISLVEEGAYLWGVEEREKGGGILKHVLLTSRLAYVLGKKLKEAGISGYENIDLGYVANGAILHDITKLYGEGREELPPEIKKSLGISEGFREISPEVDEVGISWLKEFGFPPDVYEAIRGHDFPEKIVNNPYWKIILIADYMAGQEIMPIEERLTDVEKRWITDRTTQGLPPRIELERFGLAAKNIREVAKEIFGALETTDSEFIEKHKLNSGESQKRWEKFLLITATKGKEERAKKLVKALVG